MQQKKYQCSGSRKEPEWLTRGHRWGKVRDVDRVGLYEVFWVTIRNGVI